MDYFRPRRLSDALSFLEERQAKVIAGGTDVFPALRDKPLLGPVLDTTALDGCAEIRFANGGYELGCNTTWTDLLKAKLPPAFTALKQAAREVGSIQIQNRATLAGNLCNASPAADGVPPLLVLDAEVVLSCKTGDRVLPLSTFILGNRKTALRTGELLTAIRIPAKSCAGKSAFLKLGARRYLVISIAMVAVRLVFDRANKISEAAVAIGACSVVAQRMHRVEQALLGQSRNACKKQLIKLESAAFDSLSPISDVRAPASYRKESVRELTLRAIAEAAA